VYQRAVSGHWDRILRRREVDIDRFLRVYYTSMVGERPPTGDLFDKFRKDVLQVSILSLTSEEAASLQQNIESIEMESETHAAIIKGRWPYEESSVTQWDQDRLSRL